MSNELWGIFISFVSIGSCSPPSRHRLSDGNDRPCVGENLSEPSRVEDGSSSMDACIVTKETIHWLSSWCGGLGCWALSSVTTGIILLPASSFQKIWLYPGRGPRGSARVCTDVCRRDCGASRVARRCNVAARRIESCRRKCGGCPAKIAVCNKSARSSTTYFFATGDGQSRFKHLSRYSFSWMQVTFSPGTWRRSHICKER